MFTHQVWKFPKGFQARDIQGLGRETRSENGGARNSGGGRGPLATGPSGGGTGRARGDSFFSQQGSEAPSDVVVNNFMVGGAALMDCMGSY